LIVGCDRRPSSSGTNATTTPTAQAPANAEQLAQQRQPPTTGPATTQAAPSFIWIDQTPHEFPPCKLVMKNKDDQIAALLYSDDPPNAIDDNYHGNSFYFEMTPEIAEPGTIAGANWDFKAPNSERVDTIDGIFLEGRKRHLQPFDVHIEFIGATSPIAVRLSGNFLMFDTDDETKPGQIVNVRADLSADVKVKTAK